MLYIRSLNQAREIRHRPPSLPLHMYMPETFSDRFVRFHSTSRIYREVRLFLFFDFLLTKGGHATSLG